MPGRKARLSPAAAAYFLDAIAYIAERNPTAAEALVKRMRALRERLIDFPNIGVRGQIPGTRRVVLNPFIVTIRMGKNGVEMVAIRHAKQRDAYAPDELLAGEGPEDDGEF